MSKQRKNPQGAKGSSALPEMAKLTIGAGAPTTSPRPLKDKDFDRRVNGTDMKIIVNHYPVKLSLPENLFHYDVNIESVNQRGEGDGRAPNEQKLPERIVIAVWKKLLDHFRQIRLSEFGAFDSAKNVYTSSLIQFPDRQDGFSSVLRIQDPDDPEKQRDFRLTIKLVSTVATATIDEYIRSGLENGVQVDAPGRNPQPAHSPGGSGRNPQAAVQGLDVALRQTPMTKPHFMSVNRCFFSVSQDEKVQSALNGFLDIRKGHYQALCLNERRATLNMDLATKAFHREMPVIDYLKEYFPSEWRNARHNERSFLFSLVQHQKEAKDALKGRIIKYESIAQSGARYEPSFPAQGLRVETSASYTFSLNDRTVNISTYWKEKGYAIQHPEWPVLHVGSESRTNYVPLEKCMIKVQPYKGKMDAKLTGTMIKQAALTPDRRFESIRNSFQSCQFATCRLLNNFGIAVGQLPLTLDAKKIALPKISVKGVNRQNALVETEASMDPAKYKWNYADNEKFHIPAAVPKLAAIDVAGSPEELQGFRRFLDELAKVGEQKGMLDFGRQMTEAAGKDRGGSRIICIGRSRQRNKDLIAQLQKWKNEGVKLVIIRIGDDGAEYPHVKMIAEVEVGILTACVKNRNSIMNAKARQTIMNIALKINAKLGGVNFIIKEVLQILLNKPTMIMGADVTHPAPNSPAPSVAAVTASLDKYCMKYNMEIKLQHGSVGDSGRPRELINDMFQIMGKNLDLFKEKHKRYPEQIIMFRDGVSEGYFKEVKETEFEEGIKAACKEVGISPKISFIVVKKRHHTRFQPLTQREGVRPGFNVPPGTVVTTDIVHPSERDFFLNSHIGIQGTSKPTRYHVIHDDLNLSMDQLARLCLCLCFGYSRCTQSVSYPSATYYAHLAAYRARQLVEKHATRNISIQELSDALKIQTDLQAEYPMFFV